MKKRLLLILLVIILLPITVNAKEYCTIVKGGKTIGSEIKCGDDYFYVVGNDGEDIKLLSKYSLNVGASYYSVEFTEERIDELKSQYYTCTTGTSDGSQYCYWNNQMEMFENEPEFADFNYDQASMYFREDEKRFLVSQSNSSNTYKRYTITNQYYNELREKYYIGPPELYYPGADSWDVEGLLTEPAFSEVANSENIYYLERIYNDEVSFIKINWNEPLKQDSNSIGAHGGEAGKPEFPELGVYRLNAGEILDDTASWLDIAEGYGDYDFTYHFMYTSGLNEYMSILRNKGYDIKNIHLPSIKDIDNVVYYASKDHLPFNDWEWTYVPGTDEFHSGFDIVGNFKEYLPAGYEWLYSSTYWTRTGYSDYYEIINGEKVYRPYDEYMFFVDTLGNICNSNTCGGAVGATIRPLITVSQADIVYNIEVETDGKGEIIVDKSSIGGQPITFTVKANKDYRLVSLTITTESGESIEFTEEDITENEDGTMSISTNIFTMPFENVKLRAHWEETSDEIPQEEEINPQTFDNIYLYIGLFLISGIGLYIIKKKILN